MHPLHSLHPKLSVQPLRRFAAVAALLLSAGCAVHAPVLAPKIASGGHSANVELADVPFFPQKSNQCGPAALATVLQYAGQPAAPDALSPQLYLPARRGSLQVEMLAAARLQQRIPFVLPPALDALLAELQAGRPVVVLQNLGLASLPVWHFAVVVGYSSTDESFLLRSGTEPRLTLAAADFARSWALGGQWAMVVLKPGELPASGDAARYLASVAALESVVGAGDLAPAYRAALARWPDNRIARFGLARALEAEGRAAAARHEYQTLLASAPDDIAALNNLADLQRRAGCRAQAQATIDRALAVAPRDSPLRPIVETSRDEIRAMSTGADCTG